MKKSYHSSAEPTAEARRTLLRLAFTCRLLPYCCYFIGATSTTAHLGTGKHSIERRRLSSMRSRSASGCSTQRHASTMWFLPRYEGPQEKGSASFQAIGPHPHPGSAVEGKAMKRLRA